MPSATYHVVVTFDRNAEGTLVPADGISMPNADAAEEWARASAESHASAVAWARTGDPATGEFSEATVTLSLGEVDLGALVAGEP